MGASSRGRSVHSARCWRCVSLSLGSRLQSELRPPRWYVARPFPPRSGSPALNHHGLRRPMEQRAWAGAGAGVGAACARACPRQCPRSH